MSIHSADLQTSEQQSLERERIFDAFRRWGFMDANLFPFGSPISEPFPELRFQGETADEARRIYCGAIGAEFMHLPQRTAVNGCRNRWKIRPGSRWTGAGWPSGCLQADLFEQILQTRYLGTKRYSGEGATALIPLLDMVLETGAELGATTAVMAMSHRGRLTVMNLIGRHSGGECLCRI